MPLKYSGQSDATTGPPSSAEFQSMCGVVRANQPRDEYNRITVSGVSLSSINPIERITRRWIRRCVPRERAVMTNHLLYTYTSGEDQELDDDVVYPRFVASLDNAAVVWAGKGCESSLIIVPIKSYDARIGDGTHAMIMFLQRSAVTSAVRIVMYNPNGTGCETGHSAAAQLRRLAARWRRESNSHRVDVIVRRPPCGASVQSFPDYSPPLCAFYASWVMYMAALNGTDGLSDVLDHVSNHAHADELYAGTWEWIRDIAWRLTPLHDPATEVGYSGGGGGSWRRGSIIGVDAVTRHYYVMDASTHTTHDVDFLAVRRVVGGWP